MASTYRSKEKGVRAYSRRIKNKRATCGFKDLPLLHMLVHSHPERSERTLLLYLHTETCILALVDIRKVGRARRLEGRSRVPLVRPARRSPLSQCILAMFVPQFEGRFVALSQGVVGPYSLMYIYVVPLHPYKWIVPPSRQALDKEDHFPSRIDSIRQRHALLFMLVGGPVDPADPNMSPVTQPY